MVQRYSSYGWSKQGICRKWAISIKTFYGFDGQNHRLSDRVERVQLHTITLEERQAVREYALAHTELRHREMAYRMIDEDVTYMSPSSVYRILRDYNLIPKHTLRKGDNKWDPHRSPSSADEVWQSDLTYIRYRSRDYYLLLFLDVYSRFIVYWRLCLQMTGETVRDAFEDALDETGEHPILQTDNGSCYISQEFKTLLSRAEIEHHYIHPHCPNENAEIERVNRTVKEGLHPVEAESFAHLTQLIKERIEHYNYERYHSALGYVTPFTKYRGDPGKIFEHRKEKLAKAKAGRIKKNRDRLQRAPEKMQPKEKNDSKISI
jgi:putative transposase